MTWEQLAAEAYEEHGDIDTAIKAVVDRVMNDSALYKELTVSLVGARARQAVQTAMRGTRAEFWKSTPNTDTVRGLVQRAEATARSLMDYPLEEGLRLGDATFAQVGKAAAYLFSLSQTTRVRATWLRLIEKMATSTDATVSAVLKEADLQRAQKRALKECGGDHRRLDLHLEAVAAAAVGSER